MKKSFAFLVIVFTVYSCANTNKNVVNKKTETYNSAIQNKTETNNFLKEGIDFFAQGNQPSNWQLTINYDDTVRFNAEDGLSLKFAYNQLKKEITPEKTIYSVKLKAGNTVINILEKICTVSTIREVFKKEVSVNFNDIVYTGCGKFLADDNLNNKWVLEKIGNTVINAKEYNKIPTFEFNVVEGKVIGNDGCNNVSGKIEVQGKRIKFSSLFSTKMGCNKKSIDKIIGEQISGKTVNYYFKDSKLHLYLLDDSLLVFEKEK